MIDSSPNELKVLQETSDSFFKRQEEIMKQMRHDIYEKSNIFSSEHFKRKFKTKIYPYDKIFEK